MNRNRWIVLLHDLLMVPFAWFGALWLRFNLSVVPENFFHHAEVIFPFLLLLQFFFYVHFGLYRGVWRFASLPDVVRILKAVFAATGVLAIALFFFSHYPMPRSIFPLYFLLLTGFLCGSRFTYRCLKLSNPQWKLQGERVLIIGAGAAGEALLRDVLRDPKHRYKPIGLLDDDARKKGQELHGVRVWGATSELLSIVAQKKIQQVMIAIPSLNTKEMRRIVELCKQAQVPCRTLPGLLELASGSVSTQELREISLEDLLGREPVHLSWEAISAELSNKVILVSGGGGSIGSELCQQIAPFKPKALVVLEHSEYNLYALEKQLKKRYPDVPLYPCLVSVTNRTFVENIFQQFSVDIVFHAAAYKHVPLLEHQFRSAMENNIIGTQVLAEASALSHVKKFVLISTDKAVHPTNVMGATKRVAEAFCQYMNQKSQTRFIAVRFGNVLGSTGSVVPLFREQLKQGGPITVTHPEITRFFMTIQEAVQLILQAMNLGKGGEIFVLDMGEPIKIRYLAEQMIILSGKKVGEDVEILYTGLRPGEKLYEELFYAEESLKPTEHVKILQATRISTAVSADWLAQVESLAFLCAQAHAQPQAFLKILQTLVPEYTYSP